MALTWHVGTHAIPPTRLDKARACFRVDNFTQTQEKFDLKNSPAVARSPSPTSFLNPPYDPQLQPADVHTRAGYSLLYLYLSIQF